MAKNYRSPCTCFRTAFLQITNGFRQGMLTRGSRNIADTPRSQTGVMVSSALRGTRRCTLPGLVATLC